MSILYGYVVYASKPESIGTKLNENERNVYQDGRLLCSSSPIYGHGSEIGNEDGYVVGMSTCYPQPGSVRINRGEMLSLISKYEPAQNHVGVMGLFHIMVAQRLPNSLLHMVPFKLDDDTTL